MTHEIEQKLTEIFPWVDSTQFDCGDGWQWIIVAMLKEIDDYYFKARRICKIDIIQCKEKFGYIDMYYYVDDKSRDAISKIVAKYEQLSKSTCEICGAEGRAINMSGWISVRCEECL